MPDMTLLDAIIFATKAHAGQTRKFSGEPFIVHPLRVAKAVEAEGYTEHVVIAAVLHDVVEDTGTTLHDLREAGLDDYILAIVDAVTRRPGETYVEFIQRVRDSSVRDAPGSVGLKRADIRDNLSSLPAESKSLRKRYLKALKTLENK